jgi:hypothetical protein
MVGGENWGVNSGGGRNEDSVQTSGWIVKIPFFLSTDIWPTEICVFLHYSKLILTTQKRQSFLYVKYENTTFHINKSSIQEFSLFILNRVHGIGEVWGEWLDMRGKKGRNKMRELWIGGRARLNGVRLFAVVTFKFFLLYYFLRHIIIISSHTFNLSQQFSLYPL